MATWEGLAMRNNPDYLPPELLTVEEYAARFKVSRTTVFAWLKNGELREGTDYLRRGRILRFCWPTFNSRPMSNIAESAASPLPLTDDTAQDSQRGEDTVNSKTLSSPRGTTPAINLDY